MVREDCVNSKNPNNNNKVFLQKIIIIALGIILGLIATVWGITWKATDKKAERANEDIRKIEVLLAEQKKDYKYLKEKIDQIYEEVKK